MANFVPYSCATEGYVQTAVGGLALASSVPSTTDILNNTNVGATATEGETASVNIVNKSSGTGVDFNFVLPQSKQGIQVIQGEQGIQGEPGAAGSSSSQADTVNIQSFNTGDTSNYLVFTKHSTSGYKELFEDSALKYDATNNKLFVDEIKCDTIHFGEGSATVAKITKNSNHIDLYSDNLVRFLESDASAEKIRFD